MDVSVAGMTAPTPVSEGLPLRRFVAVLRRHAWLIALCAVGGALGAYAFARTVPKSFTASSLVAVEGERLAIPELNGALRSDSPGDPMPWVRTEVQALSSRDLVAGVVRDLNLKDLPEFNPALRPPNPLARAIDGAKSAVLSLFPAPPATEGAATDPNEIVLNEALRALSLFQDSRSLVIQVSFTSYDPKLSADFANALTTAYIASRADRRTRVNEGANTALNARIDEARSDLADIERQMRDLRSKSDLVGVRAGSIGQQQAEELATAAARGNVELAQLQTLYDRASALAKAGASDQLANVLGSPTISSLRQQEAAASRRVAELSTRYGPGYPGVRSAGAELASAQRQVREETQRIISSLESQLRVAKTQQADVQQQLENARQAGIKAENSTAQLTQLQQEATTRRSLYQTLLERAQQTVAQPTGSQTPDVRVVSKAAAPLFPSSPNMKVAAGSGGIAGGLLGCLLALTRLRGPQGLRTPNEIDEALGLPVTAVLPRALLGRGRSGLAARVAQAPSGPEAEALRALKMRLSHLGRTGKPRSFAFSDGADSASSARIAVALARVAAIDNERVLLIEGNLQRPGVAPVLAQRADGLLPALRGTQDWRDEVKRDGSTPLHVLAVSEPAPNGHALLGSVQFQNLLVDAQAEYDLVIVSAPPATTPDTLVLAQRVDVTALVLDGKLRDRAGLLGAVNGIGAMSRCPLAVVLVSA